VPVAEPFLSEIRIMSFGFAPKGWALCNGQLLPINQNQALFALLGTTFGGNGQTNFALPNFEGRTPVHVGQGHTLGEAAGEPAHTLSSPEMPQHVHFMAASTSATGGSASPLNGFLGGGDNVYAAPDAGTPGPLRPDSITQVGGGQAHLNMQPFLTLSFCIALTGIFPSRN
jgi:microcystin-dependent protein